MKQRGQRHNLGRASVPERLIDAAPPSDGETRNTTVPDTFDGIRFQIGRLVKYVQEGRKDRIVIDTSRQAVAQYGAFVREMAAREGRPIEVHGNKVLQAEGLDIFCRHHFFYVNDPDGIEVIQTPRRMAKMTHLPIDVLRKVMEPYYRAMEEADPTFYRGSYSPRSLFVGDCDEPNCIFLAMCASLSIGDPLVFRFGGNGGTIHHTWARVYIDGEAWDSDVTEPGLRFGEHLEFEDYDEVEVPL